MRTKIDPRRRMAGYGIAAWLVLLIFLVFILYIGGLTYTIVKTVKRIVPPPAPDEKGWVPKIGDNYQSGVVVGLTNPPSGKIVETATSPPIQVYIYADSTPCPVEWTNLIWSGPLDSLDSVIGTNGLPLENLGSNPPAMRFYNICVQTNAQ